MAENELVKQQQVEQLRKEIDEERFLTKRLGEGFVSREQLLTFDMLERLPLVTDQVAYEFQWEQVDALYQFVDRLPAWVVDDPIMDIWASGREDLLQSFRGWEAKKVEWSQALLLSWVPARIGGGSASPMVKVYSAVVVCIHPCQLVVSIRDGAQGLVTALCVGTDEKCKCALSAAQTFSKNFLS